MSEEQKKSESSLINSITVSGTATTFNSLALIYIYFNFRGLQKEVSEEKTKSKTIRENLNLLNMVFRRSDAKSNDKFKQINNDIIELRELLMYQHDENEELKEKISKLEAHVYQQQTYNPMLDQKKIIDNDDLIRENERSGLETQKIH